MPRQVHGRSLLKAGPSRPVKRKASKARRLSALEAAEREVSTHVKIPRHRLGEIEGEDSDDAVRRDDEEGGRSYKRRKTTDGKASIGELNGQDDEDEEDEGSEVDGNRFHVGVNEDEDSEIDSEGVSGESAEDEDDDLGEDAVDLATALDMNEAEDRAEAEAEALQKLQKKKSATRRIAGSDNESAVSPDESDGSGSEDESVESVFSVSEDDKEGGDFTGLQTFVEGITSSKQGLKSGRGRDLQPSSTGRPKISAADLLQYVKDPTQRQSLKIMQAGEREEVQHVSNGIPGKLAAPLAKRQQDRLDRVAAYDKSKETLNRWLDTVKQNRRAEHLSFPLADPTKDSATGVTSFLPTSQGAPQTELEAQIQQILSENGLKVGEGNNLEEAEQAFEERAVEGMPQSGKSLEEIQARQRELRMKRELMFREEIRARRIKKIKSKAYRRVHRKERDRNSIREREALLADGMINSEDERERSERQRAEERMGARHRQSKWAKAAKATGQLHWNEDAKDGAVDLARRDAELRRRIKGKKERNSDDSLAGSGIDDDDDEDDSYNTDEDRGKLGDRLDALGQAVPTSHHSKLTDMAFMRKAEAARVAENLEEIRQIKKSLRNDEASLDASDSEASSEAFAGRQKFGQKAKRDVPFKLRAQPFEFEAPLSDDEAEVEEPSAEPAPSKASATARAPGFATSKAKLGDETKSQNLAKRNAICSSSAFDQDTKSVAGEPLRSSSKQTIVRSLDDYTSPSGSDDDDREVQRAQPGATSQDEGYTEVFGVAGEDDRDTRAQFEKEKNQLVEEEGDQVVDNGLPGWGSWTGTGVSKKQQNRNRGRFLTTVKGVAPEKRQDAKLDRVIINEKRVKKNSKYLATEMPHPFESKQQYERSLRLPMGKEWSTQTHFQEAIKPRVLLKQGRVIKPMARPTA